MGCTHDAFRHRAGAVTGAGGIETVASAEIAAAIDRELDRLREDAARMRRRLGIAERHRRDGNGGG